MAKIKFKTMYNDNQMKLGDEKKSKRELCAINENCVEDECPCPFFRMK